MRRSTLSDDEQRQALEDKATAAILALLSFGDGRTDEERRMGPQLSPDAQKAFLVARAALGAFSANTKKDRALLDRLVKTVRGSALGEDIRTRIAVGIADEHVSQYLASKAEASRERAAYMLIVNLTLHTDAGWFELLGKAAVREVLARCAPAAGRRRLKGGQGVIVALSRGLRVLGLTATADHRAAAETVRSRLARTTD